MMDSASEIKQLIFTGYDKREGPKTEEEERKGKRNIKERERETEEREREKEIALSSWK